MAKVRPEDFGAVPISSEKKVRPEDFGAVRISVSPVEQDTSSIEAFRGSGLPPIKEKKGNSLGFIGDRYVGDLESLGSIGSGMFGTFLGNLAGLGRRISGGSMKEAENTAANTAEALTYVPRTPAGLKNLMFLSDIADKTKIAGMGPPEQFMLASAVKPSIGIPFTGKRSLPDAPRSTKGAERITGELQRQHGVIESGKSGPSPVALSKVESAIQKVQGATGQFKDVLQNTQGEFDVTPALTYIDELLGGTETNAGVRSTLEAVKKEIQLALDNVSERTPKLKVGGKYALPGFGIKDGKLVTVDVSEQKTDLPIKYIDSIRQSINKIINAKDIAGKPLDKHTQELLFNVRNELIGKAPENYKKAIADIAVAKTELQAATPSQDIMGKLTTEKSTLEGQDAQNVVEAIFKSGTPRKHLTELADSVGHDPKLMQGLREAYTGWLTKVDPATEVPPAKDLLRRWSATKEAVEKSGLMTKEHAASMDMVMSDIKKSVAGGRIKKFWASTAGFIAGSAVRHPIIGAHLAGDLVSKGVSKKSLNALDQAFMKIVADQDGAAALAAPPTPANVERVRLMLPTDLAALTVPLVAQRQEETRNEIRLRQRGPLGRILEQVPR